ncbi:MAG: fasciclin domain-containing protein [Rhodospirillaceae bacterium]|nr:fasciclin domain-containing protein [Rhodospirillaceae bacterium]
MTSRRRFVSGLAAGLVVPWSRQAFAQTRNLMAMAAEIGSFKQLQRAIEVADLTEALEGEGPFTLFAPTDEAFSKLPKAALEDLLRPHNLEKLNKILKHHVLAGRVVSKDFLGKRLEAVPLAGEALLLDARKQMKIGGAKIVRTDILATNGVMHVIDTVLVPQLDDAQ